MHTEHEVAEAPPCRSRELLRRHGWVAVSAAVHGFALVALALQPPTARGLSLDGLTEPHRLVEYLHRRPTVSPADDAPAWVEPTGAAGADEANERPARAEVRRREDAPRRRGATERPRPEPTTAGALGVLSALSWDPTPSPYGALANGDGPADAFGRLLADEVGTMRGAGLDLIGAGRGARPAAPEDLVPVGMRGMSASMFATCGCADGLLEGLSGLAGHGVRGGRGSRTPDPLRAAQAEVTGPGLARDVVQRVVRRHRVEIRHCYERGLERRPSLDGRVTVSWIVAPSGAVQSATLADSTLREPGVETCLATAVRRWTFPATDGATVGVRYPFVFAAVE